MERFLIFPSAAMHALVMSEGTTIGGVTIAGAPPVDAADPAGPVFVASDRLTDGACRIYAAYPGIEVREGAVDGPFWTP